MMPRSKTDVLIVGAGVSGLTTGICLAEARLTVRLVADRPPLQTTSAVAGASWGPYMASDPRILRWSDVTRDEFRPLAKITDQTGVRFTAGMDASDEPMAAPGWMRDEPTFQIEPNPPAGFACAWRYTNPLVDMPRYLAYLERRFLAAGGSIELRRLRSLRELAGQSAVVVNCSGLEARNLVGDTALTPTRGQLVIVENPGVDYFFQDQAEEGDLTYFLPHGKYVVLGGSAIPGSEDLRIDYAIAEAIVRRCARVEPLLRDPVVVEHRVGLRPKRPMVRLERDDTLGFPVWHNYGHGGSGVTLSWGCAREIRDQVLQASTGAVTVTPRQSADSPDLPAGSRPPNPAV
jgi:D-amino-acid oxidase